MGGYFSRNLFFQWVHKNSNTIDVNECVTHLFFFQLFDFCDDDDSRIVVITVLMML